MIKKILAVDYDEDKFEIARKEWLKYNISIIMVSSTKDAIEKLITEKSFILIVICSEDGEYLLWLEPMRELTIAPVFIMKSEYDGDEKKLALKLGADEYTARPATVEESVASCLALIRRFTEYCPYSPVCGFAFFVSSVYLCLEFRNVNVDGHKIELTKTEFDLLHALISNHKIVLTFEQLYMYLKGYPEIENPKQALQAHIKRLRLKLKTASNGCNFIRSVQDVGYKFEIH